MLQTQDHRGPRTSLRKHYHSVIEACSWIKRVDPHLKMTWASASWPYGEIRLDDEVSTRIEWKGDALRIYQSWADDPEDWASCWKAFRFCDPAFALKVSRYVRSLANARV